MTDKKEQRERAKHAREALSISERDRLSHLISERLFALPALSSACRILSYKAFGAELNLDVLHSRLQNAGKILAFPVTHGQGLMDAYVPQDHESWTKDAFGIQSPIPEESLLLKAKALDVILVPCVGFDLYKMRIGWGGGYYDRYLPSCTKAYKIGVAFDVQRIEKIAADSAWDIQLDAIMTENAFYT